MGILPLRIMNTSLSCPTQEALDFLIENGLITPIKARYPALEDQAEAFEGALTGFHIRAHLLKGTSKKKDCLDEILGWYDLEDKKEFDGPFYYGLRITLESCGLKEFYYKAVMNIILNRDSFV